MTYWLKAVQATKARAQEIVVGRRSKHGLQVKDEVDLDIDGREYPLRLDNPRRYDPGAGADSENGPVQNQFGDIQTGDWSWKPHRDKMLGYDTMFKKCKFVAFTGVPKSAAEMFRGRHA